jgi:fluoride ion exporter CrcB/FEX
MYGTQRFLVRFDLIGGFWCFIISLKIGIMEEHKHNYERLSLITGCGFFGVFTAFTTAQSLATSLPGTS